MSTSTTSYLCSHSLYCSFMIVVCSVECKPVVKDHKKAQDNVFVLSVQRREAAFISLFFL